MKLTHVVPHISEEASGPSYSVPRLCQSLSQLGHETELTCLAANRDINGVAVEVHPQWPILSRFALSPRLAMELGRKSASVDIVHNHSLWSMVNVASGVVVPGKRAKLVTSPRGTLSAWALSRSRQLKRLLWPLQRQALAKADLLHATSEAELAEIRALGFMAPVAVIPNGIDLPELSRLQQPAHSPRTLLFLSRIHPKKGLDRLLQAWKALEECHSDWQLKIVGRGTPEHEQEIQALTSSLGLQRVEFPGPLYGSDKSRTYLDADLFVLPTHSENFGMVVAEALAHCCPVVVGRGAPWSGLEQKNCGWWVDNDVQTLTTTLDKAMSLPSRELAHMGTKGRAWMERDFSWPSVGQRMDAAYRWVLSGSERPEWVKVD